MSEKQGPPVLYVLWHVGSADYVCAADGSLVVYSKAVAQPMGLDFPVDWKWVRLTPEIVP